ncbi:MAG: diguanylate cyclase [Desulfosarcinaceae bacterium]
MALNYYIGPKAPTRLYDLDVIPIKRGTAEAELPRDARLFILDDADPETALATLRVIRQSSLPGVYLRPVALVGDTAHLPAHLVQAVDGRLTMGSAEAYDRQRLYDRIHTIHERIESLPDITLTPDRNIGLKVLRFLYTRQSELTPLSGVHSAQGTSYPAVDPFFAQVDESLFQVLGFLKSQGLLKGLFASKAYFCGQCQSAFLNFMEICPQCSSPDLHSDDLIHHFECGFVGNEAEFGEGEKRRCPKCRLGLRQLGVDYDKPSTVSVCNSCGHTSQDPLVTTLCYRCGAKAPPEDLLRRTIWRYDLTALGTNAARFGLDNLFRSILEREVGALPLSTFRQFLAKEIGRIKRYGKSQSSLAMFAIGELEEVYLRLGDRAKEIFEEISTVIRAVLRDSDVIASLTDAIFLILLVETPAAGAQRAMERLETAVTELLEANFQEALTLTTASRLVSGDDTVDGLIEEITPQ